MGSYGDVYIYVPAVNEIVKISEGTGANLSADDAEQGFEDYIYYEQYEVADGFEEIDGGMILLNELFRDKYSDTKEAISAVLSDAYGTTKIKYIIMEENADGRLLGSIS